MYAMYTKISRYMYVILCSLAWKILVRVINAITAGNCSSMIQFI